MAEPLEEARARGWAASRRCRAGVDAITGVIVVVILLVISGDIVTADGATKLHLEHVRVVSL